ncbi:hypothetical protein [Pantoea agglomerans]|uniref:hypothetical protein n=1 Tax=Enterobacter agglomerans TaxID=549 RepID=UPI003FD04078
MQEATQGSPVTLLIMLLALCVMAIPSFRIARKAGFDWKMGLMLSIPGINFFTYWILAFIKWPIEYVTNPLKKTGR